MRLGYGLSLEQSQKLIMTPELRQAINILLMSAVDLTSFVEEQLVENPCLDVAEEGKATEENDNEPNNETADKKNDDEFDIDWQEYFADTSDLGYVQVQKHDRAEEIGFEHFFNQGPTLHEHLLFQLSLVKLSDRERHVAQFIIGNIDDNGYLQTELTEVSQRYSMDIAQVENILGVIHGFEPTGVGARNLTECLLLQLDALEMKSSVVRDLVKNHLNELSEGKLPKIAKKMQISLPQLQQAVDFLKNLDPKPGSKYGNTNDIRYIVPDILIERIGNEYVVLVNDVSVPRLSINNGYRQLLYSNNPAESETKKYVESKLNAASWLIKSIEQRRVTLYKVANCIVELQRQFMDKGVKYLKPLKLKQVAEKVNLHESTVSRATSNKYVQTPQGVFEMKFFFTSGVDNNSGEQVSSESVKKILKELINAENHAKPLSDQKLTELIGNKGINISRRTIAKYRDELSIPAASKRKRY